MSAKILSPMGTLSESQLAAAERELGLSFPADYRAFMQAYNGGSPDPDGFDIFWPADREAELAQDWRTSSISYFLSIYDGRHINFLEYNKVTFAGRIPKETFAIARDPGGNLILLATAGPHAGNVLFWVKDHESQEGPPGYANVALIADSFEQLLTQKLR